MNRDAIMVYLRDIRDLEVAKYCIAKLYYEGKSNETKKLKNLKRKNEKLLHPEFKYYPAKPSKPGYQLDLEPILILFAVFSLIWFILMVIVDCFDNFEVIKYQLNCWAEGNWLPLTLNIILTIPGLPGLVCLIYVLLKLFKYLKEKKLIMKLIKSM